MSGKLLHKMVPYLVGTGASLGLIAFYLSIMALTADWYYAAIQFEEYRWWILALAMGLGVQSALFVLIKRRLQGMEKKAATSTLAASGGFSTGAMIACCLHHLTDIVPILGLPALAMTLQKYQPLFFLIGVFFNLFGILMMLRMMARHGMIRSESALSLLTPILGEGIRTGREKNA